MHILFATSEVAPFFKRGGLGDVSSALPKALSHIGIRVSVVMPYYAAIPVSQVRNVGQMTVDFAGRRQTVFVFATTLPGSAVTLYLLRHQLFDEYQGRDMPLSFVFFSRAVAHMHIHAADILGEPFDIVHANDWHTALIPMLIGENNKLLEHADSMVSKAARTVFTIHNLMYQGNTTPAVADALGKPASLFHVYQTTRGKRVKLLREGLEYADIISTVSPTYAKEILTSEYGQQLDSVFMKRRDKVRGILNGIDTAVWDPAGDEYVEKQYTVRTVHDAKTANRGALRKAVGLPQTGVPLLAFVGRLETRQKGVELVRRMMRDMVQHTAQLIILGTGDQSEVKLLHDLATARKDVAFVNRFDERMAHMIYAGADIMLIPSKFEPCGLIQMIAMRYGTIPVVRKTGGLADSVTDRKTGFVFPDYDVRSLAAKVKEAIGLRQREPRRYREMVERVMAEDFSWEKSAVAYKSLYESLLSGPRRRTAPGRTA